jgi:hypothetical protein
LEDWHKSPRLTGLISTSGLAGREWDGGP